jgi:hypothetical protein
MRHRNPLSPLSPYCPCTPAPEFPLFGSHAQAQPPAVIHQARRASVLPSVVRLKVRKTEREASRLSRFPQSDHSATGTQYILFPTAHSANSLRERNRKTLAANRVPGFTRRMTVADIGGSKLSASLTRQNRRRPAVPCFVNLGRVARPPVPSPLVPQAAAETVPVSALFELQPGYRQAAVFRAVEVRP